MLMKFDGYTYHSMAIMRTLPEPLQVQIEAVRQSSVQKLLVKNLLPVWNREVFPIQYRIKLPIIGVELECYQNNVDGEFIITDVILLSTEVNNPSSAA